MGNFLKTTTILVLTVILGLLSLIAFPLNVEIVRFWARLILKVSGVKLKISGVEKLNPGQPVIYIANHESALDIPVALAALPKSFCFMAKKELFWIPVVGWVLFLGGHIRIDRQNPQKAFEMINRKAIKIVRKGHSILVSPEGTRSPDGKIGKFKRGGFRLSEKLDVPIVPVMLLGTRYCVAKKALKILPGIVEVTIDSPIRVSDFSELDRCIDSIRDRMIKRKLAFETQRMEKSDA
ncbi:MAG: 1-acyl-sn-glycerol-3-phosphate acyltransferase [Candidatus Marinimicrobia bacterium CG08_land_8_20_14_0_20_45_22]|nr:MAG: 1-acyl-sn-glycerol-3-phosphate acyltransferase [Candidatus Marinimicrobia bacterium CG08_land_8_20_14_0_20_45_22]